MCAFGVMCTVSMPNAFIWSALFSAMVKNFFGSDRASTIAETHKTTCWCNIGNCMMSNDVIMTRL